MNTPPQRQYSLINKTRFSSSLKSAFLVLITALLCSAQVNATEEIEITEYYLRASPNAKEDPVASGNWVYTFADSVFDTDENKAAISIGGPGQEKLAKNISFRLNNGDLLQIKKKGGGATINLAGGSNKSDGIDSLNFDSSLSIDHSGLGASMSDSEGVIFINLSSRSPSQKISINGDLNVSMGKEDERLTLEKGSYGASAIYIAQGSFNVTGLTTISAKVEGEQKYFYGINLGGGLEPETITGTISYDFADGINISELDYNSSRADSARNYGISVQDYSYDKNWDAHFLSRNVTTSSLSLKNIVLTAPSSAKSIGLYLLSEEKPVSFIVKGTTYIENILTESISAKDATTYGILAEGGSTVDFQGGVTLTNIGATGNGGEVSALLTWGGSIIVGKEAVIENITGTGDGLLATGIQVYPGEVTINGDLTITEVKGAESYSLYAFNDSEAGFATIMAEKASSVEGDIFAKKMTDPAITAQIGYVPQNGSEITLGFDGNGKYLKAFSDIDEYSKFNLTLSNIARWEVVTSNPETYKANDSYVSSVTTLDMSGGKVYVGSTQSGWGASFSTSLERLKDTDKAVQLKINNLSGNGDFYLRVDAEKKISDSVLVTEFLTGNFNLNVKATGQNPPEIQEQSYLARAENAVGASGSEFTLGGGKVVDGVPVIDIGVYNYKLDTSERNGGREWYLVRTKKQPDKPTPGDPTQPDVPPSEPDLPVYSPTAEAVLAMAGMGAQSGFYQNQLTDVRKRLGEIRGGIRDGLWASVAGQKDRLSGFAGTNFKQDVYRFNFGADAVVGDWILGGNFKYINADQKTRDTYFKAKGEAHSEGVNLYATWQNEKGCYADFILSADRYHQRINNTMLDGTGVKGTYRNLGLGVSAEIGKKFTLDKAQNWFAEPQLQLSYYHVKGDDFSMSNGMKVKQGNFNSLTGRLGVATGYEVESPDGKPKGQVYLRTGLKHEFLGKQTLHVNDVKFRDKLVGTRAYYGLATDWNLTKNLKVYGHVERENGSHYTKEIEVMAGVKYSF